MDFTAGNLVAEHYRLIRPLGSGSFGNVWLAHHELADIDVAIKFYGAADEKGIKDFRREFQLAYRLNHPNLVHINHFDVVDGCPYLVMPYYENGSVLNRVGRMSEQELWHFVHDVAAGLHYLHSQQPPIIHQDIKPGNILQTETGEYVITDFGISRSLQVRMTGHRSSISSGTLAYMSPERFAAHPATVLAGDIWSLGMTLYELATGDVLWEMGGSAQLSEPQLPQLGLSHMPQLEQLIGLCLSRQPEDRPTARVIAEWAEQWLTTGDPRFPMPKEQTPAPQPAPQTYTTTGTNYTVGNISSSVPAEPSGTNGWTQAYMHASESSHTPTGHHSTQGNEHIWRYRLPVFAAAFVVLVALGIAVTRVISYTPEEIEPFTQQEQTPTTPAATAADETTAHTGEAPHAEGSTTIEATQPAAPEVQTVVRYVDVPATPPRNKTRKADKATGRQGGTPTATQGNTYNDPSYDDNMTFESCHSIEQFESYLRRYPQGLHRSEAQYEIQRLSAERAAAAQHAIRRPMPSRPPRPRRY